MYHFKSYGKIEDIIEESDDDHHDNAWSASLSALKVIKSAPLYAW